MKHYIITGSLGHISRPIVSGLVTAGQKVSVITSDSKKVTEIERLGANALAGSIQDGEFVKQAFRGADVVYTMIPPIYQTTDWRKSQNEIADHYITAIKSNNIKTVVNLSSVGAHLKDGCGPVNGLHDLEQKLNAVSGLNVKHLRPVSFYYNLLNQIGLIKHAGIVGNNYGGGDQKVALVHPNDIAAVALEELLRSTFTGNSIRYILSDLRTGQEIAAVLGNAIGKQLNWVEFSDDDNLKGLLQAGLPEVIATSLSEMGTAMRTGRMQEDLLRSLPATAPTKLETFAKDFAVAFKAAEVPSHFPS